MQTGIGKQAILDAIDRLMNSKSPEPPRGILLAGACGALTNVEDVPSVERIIDEEGGEWTCRFAPPRENGSARAATLLAVDRIISTPSEKAAAASATGAAIVDMESHAFARACGRLGIAWHVVRGVSDTPDETLPSEVLGWIDPSGNTRIGRAAIGLARRPSLIGHLAPVIRRSNRVLPLVGREVLRTIRYWTSPRSAQRAGDAPR